MPAGPQLLMIAPQHERDRAGPDLWQPVKADWTREMDGPFNDWVDAFVEEGVWLVHDHDQALPKELPAARDDIRAVLIDPALRGWSEIGDVARRLDAWRREGVLVQVLPAAGVPDRVRSHTRRLIASAGLTTLHPGMIEQLRSVSDQRLMQFALDTLERQVELLLASDAGWAWGDPVAYHVYWPAQAAAEHFGRPELMEPCWRLMRQGLDRSRWKGVVSCGKRFALMLGEHDKNPAAIERVRSEVEAGVSQTGRHWRLDGVYLNMEIAPPPGADADDPPPLVRQNAWTWPETSGNLGDGLAYLSKVTGDMRYAEAAVRQVLGSHRWCFDTEKQLWRHMGRPTGPERRSACWGRGNGWMLYGVRGLLEDLPLRHPARPALVQMLKDELEGLLATQTELGLWRTVLDASADECPLESSSAWMIINVYARAWWKGWLRDERAAGMCRRAWQGLKSRIWRGIPLGQCAGTSYMLERYAYLARPFTRFFPPVLILPMIELQRMEKAG